MDVLACHRRIRVGCYLVGEPISQGASEKLQHFIGTVCHRGRRRVFRGNPGLALLVYPLDNVVYRLSKYGYLDE